jgi:hypothetical protein
MVISRREEGQSIVIIILIGHPRSSTLLDDSTPENDSRVKFSTPQLERGETIFCIGPSTVAA